MNEDFVNSLFEKLTKLRQKKIQSYKSKQEPATTPPVKPVKYEGYDQVSSQDTTPFPLVTPKNEENISATGTPQTPQQGGETRRTKKTNPSKLEKSDENKTPAARPYHKPDPLGDKSDVKSSQQKEEKQTGDVTSDKQNKEEVDQENLQIQVGEDWYFFPKTQLAALQQQAAQIAAQKAAQQVFYMVVEPPPTVSKIRRETAIPVQSVVTILIIATLPFVHGILKNATRKEKIKVLSPEG